MDETPETNIEPTTSTSDKEDNLSTLVKAPDEIQDADANDPVVIENIDVEKVVEQVEPSTVVPKNDLKLDEIKIVAVASAVTDDSIKKIINDEQEPECKSIKSINNSVPEPESTQVKPPDDRNETRVISLDTIIRKGLNEQMPMTAKDIDNIVPNAIKQQQDANLKQSEKLANEKEFALVYESSDDYNSSGDEKFEDDLAEDVNAQQPIEEETNNETEAGEKVEATDDNENENHSPQSICEALLEDKAGSDTAVPTVSPAKDVTEQQMEDINANSNESNDSSASDHSFDDFDSESNSTHSSHKKRKRRKSAATQHKVKDDVSKKSDEIGEDMVNDPGPRLNRRGKPRKSYDETDNEQVKKKVGRKLKIQRYSGPKRPGVRVSNLRFISECVF